jgi:D-alanyl-lipoteichoic acid acyltransferase DltB (MBOAT superfamily)
MLFNSFPFVFIFMPAALAGFWLACRAGSTAARSWLLASSLAFYTWWYPPFTPLLLASIAFNYCCGWLIVKLHRSRLQSVVLTLGIIGNLGALAWYKYAFVLAEGLFHLGLTPAVGLQPVLLPLGISFFTFTQIGFLLDCRGGGSHEQGVLDYALFVTFFPHLLAGPILQHRRILPQLRDGATYRPQLDNLATGATLFAIGLFKKTVFADSIAIYVNPAFDHTQQLGLFAAWGAAIGYALQLYFDFSGYSDMAIGLARMFNLRFPINFDSPYKARNIIEYWQRWHISLTRFLTNFVYGPISLAITRRRAARGLPISRQALATPAAFAATVGAPLTVTMTLAGIWHGAGLQFVVFGLMHAAYLLVNHAWRMFALPRVRPNRLPRLAGLAGTVAGALMTFIAVVAAEVFFRASSVAAALGMLAGMCGQHGVESAIPVPAWVPGWLGSTWGWIQGLGFISPVAPWQRGGDPLREICLIIVLLGVVWLAPNSQAIAGLADADARRQPAPARRGLAARMPTVWSMAVGAVMAFAILGMGAESEFLYFKF